MAENIPTNDPRKIGIVGIGTMGFNMMKALIAAGHTVYVCDKDKQRIIKAQEIGAGPVESPRDSARLTDITLLSLPMPADVAGVVFGKEGIVSGAQKGHIIVDLSTVDPFSTKKNAEIAAGSGIGYLDAPVLGRPQACGKWTLPVGGEKSDLDKVSGVLEAVAKKVVYCGPSGTGNIIKLLNNMMFSNLNTMIAEIMALSAKLGLDPKVFYDTISQSGAATVSNLFLEMGPKIFSRDFSCLFSVDLLHKDINLGMEMARQVEAPLFITPAAQLLNEISRARKLNKEDTSAVVKVYEDIYGVEVK